MSDDQTPTLTRRALLGASALALAACHPSLPKEAAMMTLRPAAERFHTRIGWLDSWHSFSFGNHYDDAHMGYGPLRVINDDRITAGAGFGTHPHKDMEIVSYVVNGALAHKDSMGNGSTIVPGDVQRMSAGTGVLHSEMNPKKDAPAHFLQIWLLPKTRGITPGYEQVHHAAEAKRDTLRLLASDAPKDGAVAIHSDVDLYGSILSQGKSVEASLRRAKRGWLQVVSGSVRVSDGDNELVLGTGDGVAIAANGVAVEGVAASTEFLLFDLGA